MQLTSKLKNKSTAWTALLKPRVGDVVVLAGAYYENISGVQSVVTNINNWFPLSSGGGSAAVVINKIVGDIAGSDPNFYIDLTGSTGLPDFPASMAVYIDINNTGDFQKLEPVSYDAVTHILGGMNSPTDFVNQKIKIVVI